MLDQNTLKFLTLLHQNNNRAWFDEHRKAYEAAKLNFEAFVADILQQNISMVPEWATRKPKDCIFRIFKDVRFSKDKVPYKNNFGAAFGKGDKKILCAAYYVHIQPGNSSFVGGGIWMPDGPNVKAIRQEIDYNFVEFKKIIDKPSFVKNFGNLDQSQKLKKCPKDYSENNPALDFLKLKSFTVGKPISDKELLSENAVQNISILFKEMKPFIDFLNKAIEQ